MVVFVVVVVVVVVVPSPPLSNIRVEPVLLSFDKSQSLVVVVIVITQ